MPNAEYDKAEQNLVFILKVQYEDFESASVDGIRMICKINSSTCYVTLNCIEQQDLILLLKHVFQMFKGAINASIELEEEIDLLP